MRRLIALVVTVATVLLLGSGLAIAQATTETSNVMEPVSFTIEDAAGGIICPEYDEPILVEGVFHHLVHVTTDANGGYHYVIRTNTQNVTATGLETGEEYQFINPVGAIGGSGTGMETSKAEGTFHVISRGASSNLLIHYTETLVFDEDFDPYLSFQMGNVGCTPNIETGHNRD
jgi:hypothetical protein